MRITIVQFTDKDLIAGGLVTLYQFIIGKMAVAGSSAVHDPMFFMPAGVKTYGVTGFHKYNSEKKSLLARLSKRQNFQIKGEAEKKILILWKSEKRHVISCKQGYRDPTN
jgi:hypothetical protein